MPSNPKLAIWALLHTDELAVARAVAAVRDALPYDEKIWWYIGKEPPEELQPIRFVDENITFCFGMGKDSGILEGDLAWWLESMAYYGRVDVVWDWHQTTGGTDFVFYNLCARQSPFAMGIASLLRCNDAIVVCEPGHPAEELSQIKIPYVGFDVRPDSCALENLEGWLYAISEDGWVPAARPMREWLLLRAIRISDARRLGLPPKADRFERLDDWVADELGYPKPLHVLSAGGFTDGRYWGEMVTPLDEAKIPAISLRLYAYTLTLEGGAYTCLAGRFLGGDGAGELANEGVGGGFAADLVEAEVGQAHGGDVGERGELAGGVVYAVDLGR